MKGIKVTAVFAHKTPAVPAALTTGHTRHQLSLQHSLQATKAPAGPSKQDSAFLLSVDKSLCALSWTAPVCQRLQHLHLSHPSPPQSRTVIRRTVTSPTVLSNTEQVRHSSVLLTNHKCQCTPGTASSKQSCRGTKPSHAPS